MLEEKKEEAKVNSVPFNSDNNQAKKFTSKEEDDGKHEEIEIEVDLKETIHGAGLLEFQNDIGIVEDDDPTMMIIAWKLKAETLWEISRDEFINGFTIFG